MTGAKCRLAELLPKQIKCVLSHVDVDVVIGLPQKPIGHKS